MGSIPRPIVEPHLKESSFNVPKAPYPMVSTAPLPEDPAVIKKIATDALVSLNVVLKSENYAELRNIFLTESCFWRDHLGLTSTKFVTLNGADDITSFVSSNCSPKGKCAIQKFALDVKKDPQIANLDPECKIKYIQAFVVFETEHATGRGLMTLLRDIKDSDKWKIFMLFTSLSALKDHLWKDGSKRDLFGMPENVDKRLNWADWKEQSRNFAKESPAVLVVGGGHSGLMIAARLKMLGVEALLIDKSERTGNSWRKRYHNLVLHDPCWMNALPYLNYPPNWPIYASKDKMADFLEFYASTLELNVWNQTEVVEAKWDKGAKRWTVVLERFINETSIRRTLHPRHLIQATGLNGEPRVPSIPGHHNFLGSKSHSSSFQAGTPAHAGKKVVVVGTGSSAHDIADDLYRHGAHVTIIQRSPTYIITLSSVLAMISSRYIEGNIMEDSDLLTASMPTAVGLTIGSDVARIFGKRDQPVLEGLKAVGFKIDESLPAVVSLTIHRAGGFYINSGTSEIIIEGGIKVKHTPGITRIKSRSVVLEDGEEVEADEIIFATGYENGRVRTRKIFGDEVADSILPIWGYDEMGEIRGVWRRSGHEGFWVAAGSFWLSRYYSVLLALQIKMVEEGLIGV